MSTMTTDGSRAVACPTSPVMLDGKPHTVIGCGSINVARDENEPALWDCLDCGIFFDPSKELAAAYRPARAAADQD